MLEYLTKEAPVRWGGGFERSDNLMIQKYRAIRHIILGIPACKILSAVNF
jgi:hypothetical protein